MGLGRPRIGIVGGTRGMGSWFGDLFEDLGLEVIRCGRTTPVGPRDIASLCDVVVLSVPIKATLPIIEQIGPLLGEEALLMDLTSLKASPLASMLSHSRSQVVGLHPLFGPKSNIKEGLSVAVCPGRGQEGLDWILDLLAKAGLKPVLVDAVLHDQIMGVIQVVHHFSMLSLAYFIAESGHLHEEISSLSTYSFRETLKRIESILGQTTELFGPLLMENPFSRQYIQLYEKSCKKISEIISSKQDEDFRELFISLKKYFKEEVIR